ncbi:MAG: flavodoxin [Duncaniella sp.]|nr:flavodoxin [Duncaniella sp.]
MKFILTAFCIATVSLTSCSQNKSATEIANDNSNTIVCYFSATGTTEAAAKRIAAILGCDIYEIAPESRYTAEDLDWTDSLSRCYVEMHNRTMRPALKDSVTDLSSYSVVYIGYPNWWNTHPTIINSYIEANNFEGKTIVPFMTTGGSNITNSEKELKEQYPNLIFGQGLLMNGRSDDEIKNWTSQFK